MLNFIMGMCGGACIGFFAFALFYVRRDEE